MWRETSKPIFYHSQQLRVSSIRNCTYLQRNYIVNDLFCVKPSKQKIFFPSIHNFFQPNNYFQNKCTFKYTGVDVHNYPTKKTTKLFKLVFANISINICLRVSDPWQASAYSLHVEATEKKYILTYIRTYMCKSFLSMFG